MGSELKMGSKYAAKSVINNGVFEVHGPDLQEKTERKGLGTVFFEKLEEYSYRILQVFVPTGDTETYGHAKQRAVRLALELKKQGIKSQDVVCLCSFNCFNATISVIATQFIGGVIASLDPTQDVRDMVYLMGVVKPKILIIGLEAVEKIQLAVKEGGYDIPIIVFGNATGCLPFSEFQIPSAEEKLFTPYEAKPDDTAFIMFSSGTTGLPKGLCLSNHGLLHAAESLYELGIDVSSILHYSSYYWITAVNLTCVCILKGGKRILVPTMNADKLCQIVQDYKVTYTFLPSPAIYKLNEKNTLPYDTSSFKLVMFGGGPIGDQLKVVQKLLPHSVVILCYGQTEISGFFTGYHPKNDYKKYINRPVSCGYPAPDVSMRIVDPETEKPLGPNEKGEIRAKCNSFFVGYLNADNPDLYDKDGFIKTGDIGYFDDDNFLYVVDRIKEMFKYQSWHVVPSSLEMVLHQHPAVNEAVVYGVPHEEDGDHPAAIVTLKNGYSNITAKDIEKFMEERVIDREKLRGGVTIVDFILKTPSGKPARHIMKQKMLKKEQWCNGVNGVNGVNDVNGVKK